MATIILSSFVIRHPVGGVLSNNLQFLTGFQRLGHDVYLVEKAGYEGSCFDPERRASGDDSACGLRRIDELLSRHGLAGRWCYVGPRPGATTASTGPRSRRRSVAPTCSSTGGCTAPGTTRHLRFPCGS